MPLTMNKTEQIDFTRRLALASLLVWLYFTEGVVRAWSDRAPGNYLGLIEVFLCLTLFAACALHVRVRLKNTQAPITPTTPATP